MKIDYSSHTFHLIGELDPRTKEILSSRFGLEKHDPRTLEAIGKDFDITRERVRQIVEEGIRASQNKLQQEKKNPFFANLFSRAGRILRQSGDVKREDMFLSDILEGESSYANHVVFLLTVAPRFVRFRENDLHYTFWASDPQTVSGLFGLLKNLVFHFEKEQQPLAFEELKKSYGKEVHSSHLEITKAIERGHDNKWGLVHWPMIRPRGVRDKAYLLLKFHGKPLHFTEITQRIDEMFHAGSQESRKRALIQTVHNELIKDPRFVLVGRGIYGLEEWGLKPGTVKDVISQILKEQGHPMSREILMKKILSQRIVKPSTVLLNLQDRDFFDRDEQGRYLLR